jgi:outer membrane protein OmpA-like peptidoglycan-associated protein
MNNDRVKIAVPWTLLLAAFLLLPNLSAQQNTEVTGVIDERNGEAMTVETQDAGDVIVLLTLATQFEEPKGIFRTRRLAVTALVPGLLIELRGSYDAHGRLVAEVIKFNASSLQTALDIQAGVAQAKQQLQESQKQIERQPQEIEKEEAQLVDEQRLNIEPAQEMAETKRAIAVAGKRFGKLADYNVLGEVTVPFANEEVKIEEPYQPQLLKLAEQAKGTVGYLIEVKGYESKVGSAALNQALSQRRAENVTNFLEQQGRIPLTHILAPGSMGSRRQAAGHASEEGQATNRQVLVVILQNKDSAEN